MTLGELTVGVTPPAGVTLDGSEKSAVVFGPVYVSNGASGDGTVATPLATVQAAANKVKDFYGTHAGIWPKKEGEPSIPASAGIVLLDTVTDSNIVLTGEDAWANPLPIRLSAPNSSGGDPLILKTTDTTNSLIAVGANVTLTLEDITIAENENMGVSLIEVGQNGKLILGSGASIKNNKVGAGSTVSVYGALVMEGGEISDNENKGRGAVYVSGTFTMTSGSITKNKATTSGPTKIGNGGGVNVSGGMFKMEGGTISGNTAAAQGGGVYIGGGTFIKTGGIIYGSDATPSDLANQAKQDDAGHAIYHTVRGYYDSTVADALTLLP
jgi:hypothetical protein